MPPALALTERAIITWTSENSPAVLGLGRHRVDAVERLVAVVVGVERARHAVAVGIAAGRSAVAAAAEALRLPLPP